MRKRLLAILATAAMVVAMVPAMAFAGTTLSAGTEAELETAISTAASGDTIKLTADFATTKTFTIPDSKSITFDMNGKKITATDNKAANVCYELFYIYGGLTVTGNGTIELTSTSNDTAWAKSSTIFHNRGGVLNIENGTYKHLGGTCMAYVVDNSGNSYGDATTFIKGGSLSSTYIAIRNRMEAANGNGGANGTAILNVLGGTIDGDSRAIWAQASSPSTTAPATGEINISGGEVGLIDTARNAGAVCDTVITGGSVEKIKAEESEVSISGGYVGTLEILDATGTAVDADGIITGGEFGSDVNAFLADGYELVEGKVYKEGTAPTKPVAKPEKSPNTGDNNMAPFAVAGLVMAAMAAVVVTRRRTN